MQSYYPKRSPHSTTRLTSDVMIMKTLTTMRSNLIVISILYPLFKLMTLSLLLEMFELFNTVFDKEIFHIELPLLQYFLQKHVRDVHLALSLLWCGIAFQDVGYGNVKHRVVLCLLPPFVVAVNIREGCHFTAFQDHQSVIELTFATGGQPDVFGEKEGADDCGLLRLHQCNIGIDLILEQVLAEQALGESPLRLKQVRGLEVGVHPHYRREMVILDAVAGLRVVGDDFPAAAATPRGIESNRITNIKITARARHFNNIED